MGRLYIQTKLKMTQAQCHSKFVNVYMASFAINFTCKNYPFPSMGLTARKPPVQRGKALATFFTAISPIFHILFFYCRCDTKEVLRPFILPAKVYTAM